MAEARAGRIVVVSGAGISAESGLPVYRGTNGLWRNHPWMELASVDGWRHNPHLVLEFYNERRANAWQAQPNEGHKALAALEAAYDVTIVTQNVDELHERAGSSHVLHLHGQLAYARGTSSAQRRYCIEDRPISMGQLCEDGTQLRPDIVWFGEAVQGFDAARECVAHADKVLVVGTSLSVYPAAFLVGDARSKAEKVLVALEVSNPPPAYVFMRGKATEQLPQLAARWLAEAERKDS